MINSDTPKKSRRNFLKQGGALGLASLALPRVLAAEGKTSASESVGGTNILELPELPDRVLIATEGAEFTPAAKTGNRFGTKTVNVEIKGRQVFVAAPTGPLSRVVLRWEKPFTPGVLFLGDHWERGYGDLQWKFLQPERVMPWYFAAHDITTEKTFLAGVATQPNAFCFWTVDAEGISLWMDFRNGGSSSIPGDRSIHAATIVSFSSESGEAPMQALQRFCATLSPNPRLSNTPICGNNNWYYAYGRDFDANAIRRDAAFLAEISTGCAVRPFCVIDAGWTPGSVCPGGPWTGGDPARFPDMVGLARDIKALGVRPGIWVRPTALTFVDNPARLRRGPVVGAEKPLDLTMPENLAGVREDIKRIRGWGYELIKHDFSTFDLLGKWGFEMGAEITAPGWHFHDQSLTNAEIILSLYRTLREGAGDAVLLGCNTVGHLGAGLFEIQRAGDDTSGREWERTRRMGVNTLAYRLPQHNRFFACDADCAAYTSKTPWPLAQQFLDLVARSGTPLFISVDPRTASDEQKNAFRAAMHTALAGGSGGCEPQDWLFSTAPERWHLGKESVRYDWSSETGSWPFAV